MIKHIPNTVTCLNLFSGCVGVWFAFNGNYEGVALAVIFSAVFDFLDGMAARLLRAYSPMGKELDSLADVISFGLVPGALIFHMLSPDLSHNYAFVGFLLTIFSALRLAKFNIDERQTSSFIGLPVPANAIFWAGIALAWSEWFIANPYILLGLTVFFSYLLVAEIPMFSLKFKNLSWKDNKVQFIFLGGSVLLIAILWKKAISPLIMWNILLSVIVNFIQVKKAEN